MLENYIEVSSKTAIYPNAGTIEGLTYVRVGLLSELGECYGVVKRAMRDSGGELDKDAMALEVGDLLWYTAQYAKCSFGEKAKETWRSFLVVRQLIMEDDIGFFYKESGPLTTCLEILDAAFASITEHADDPEYTLFQLVKLLERLAKALGRTLEEIAIENAAKLEDRKQRGKLQGKGDKR